MNQRVELLKVADLDNHTDIGDYRLPPTDTRKPLKNPCCWAKHQCCPLWCYNRNCVLVAAVLTVIATITSVAVLIGFSVSIVHPHLHVLSFVEGRCTTTKANYTGTSGSCGCTQGGRSCPDTYPCLEVFVTYPLAGGEVQSAILYASDYELSYVPHCSILPHCESGNQNREEVEAFRRKWGTPGQTMTCLHDPTGSGAVIERLSTPHYVRHILLWPCVCTAVSLVLCVFVFFHCVPKYCNKGS